MAENPIKYRDPPLVTVLMSVYNGEKFLHQTIQSVLDQSFRNFEFLIVENGSRDRSLSIVESFNDPRICVTKFSKNRGLSKALNHGIENSSTDLIARIDADDIMKNNRLEEQFAFMSNNHQVVLLGTSIERIFADGSHRDIIDFPCTHKDILAYFSIGSPFAHPSVMYRKSAINRLGNYDENLLYAQDFKLWLKVAKHYQTCNLKSALTIYRTHSGQNSSKVAKESATIFEGIIKDSFWDDKLDKRIASQTLEKWRSVPCESKLSKQRIKKLQLWSKILPPNSNIGLYGGGDHTIRLLNEIKNLKDFLQISFIIDRKPISRELEGIPIYTPDFLEKNDPDFIIISSYFYEKEIYSELLTNFKPNKTLRFYELE